MSGLTAASTRPLAMPMMTVARNSTSKFGATSVSSVPPMWPAAASRMMRAHAEEVAERAADEDRQAEAPERRARDPADVGLVQVEERLEVAHDVAADGERHRGGDERDATGREEPSFVHGDVYPLGCGAPGFSEPAATG